MNTTTIIASKEFFGKFKKHEIHNPVRVIPVNASFIGIPGRPGLPERIKAV